MIWYFVLERILVTHWWMNTWQFATASNKYFTQVKHGPRNYDPCRPLVTVISITGDTVVFSGYRYVLYVNTENIWLKKCKQSHNII